MTRAIGGVEEDLISGQRSAEIGEDTAVSEPIKWDTSWLIPQMG